MVDLMDESDLYGISIANQCIVFELMNSIFHRNLYNAFLSKEE